MPVTWLLDTGANRTIVSKKTFKRIPKKIRDKLTYKDTGDLQLQLANGTPINIETCVTVNVQIGPVSVLHNILVCDIFDQAILGLDFLKEHCVQIDLGTEEIMIKGMWVPCQSKGNNQLLERGKLSDNYRVAPARSDLLVGACREKIPVQILNTPETDVQLHKDTMVGYREAVEDMEVRELSQGEGLGYSGNCELLVDHDVDQVVEVQGTSGEDQGSSVSQRCMTVSNQECTREIFCPAMTVPRVSDYEHEKNPDDSCSNLNNKSDTPVDNIGKPATSGLPEHFQCSLDENDVSETSGDKKLSQDEASAENSQMITCGYFSITDFICCILCVLMVHIIITVRNVVKKFAEHSIKRRPPNGLFAILSLTNGASGATLTNVKHICTIDIREILSHIPKDVFRVQTGSEG